MEQERVTEADEYVCTLSLQDQETARNELREDDSIRQQALDSIRHWLSRNPRIEACRFDSNFILRFLRFKKFSVIQAQEAIERYLLLRQSFSIAFRDLDVLSPRMQELLDRGVVFSSPHRDSLGRRMIIVRIKPFDPYVYTKEDICKLAGIIHESLIEEESSQINGFTYFTDCEGIGFPYLTLFTPKESVRIVRNGESTVPMRHKDGHGINFPSALKFVADFGMSIIAEKYKKRVHIHDSPDVAMETVDKRQLPKEWGGEVPMEQMIADFKEELLSKREKILTNDRMAVRLEFYNEHAKEGAVSALKHGMLCKSESERYVNDLCGNFRKLEVD